MAWTNRGKRSSVRSAAIAGGWRSGLEDAVSKALTNKGAAFSYERLVVSYLPPAKIRKYTPDFLLSNGIIVETKGRFVTEDRQKHLMVKEQHPDLDIRFVFTNPNARISKTSNTTYAAWCDKHGFLYAAKTVPDSWINDQPETDVLQKRLNAAMAFFKTEE